nr:MAG TPA: hypothetical protein [Caudoviricetes sp.]
MSVRIAGVGGEGLKVKTGVLTNIGKEYVEIPLGFKPVQIVVEIYHKDGSFRTTQVYDRRVSATTVQKVGQDTNNTLGMPTEVSALFSNDGKSFKVKDGYGATWPILRYTAISRYKD